MTQEFIINVLLIITIYLLALEVLVFIGKKIKNYVCNELREYEEVGVVEFDEVD